MWYWNSAGFSVSQLKLVLCWAAKITEEDQHDEREKVQPLSDSGSSFLEIYSTPSNLRQPVVYWGCTVIILCLLGMYSHHPETGKLGYRECGKQKFGIKGHDGWDMMAGTREFWAASQRSSWSRGSVLGMGRQKSLSFCSLIVYSFGIHLWQNITVDTFGKS